MTLVVALVLAYVLGSFPSAYLIGRLVKGVDLRTVGSGNLGATNVYRQVGAIAALVVLALDVAKGWLAVSLVPALLALDGRGWGTMALGAAAVFGHAAPVFLLWRGGGKGAATAVGVFFSLAPLAISVSVLGFATVVGLTRYVSAGSVTGAIVLPVSVALIYGVAQPVFVTALILAIFVVWAHRANLRRLSLGQEPRIGRPGAAR
jgi:glycerol-3-phosphate acyltransferase PlsY